MSLIKNIFFKDNTIKTFFITRLLENQVEEKVFLKHGARQTDITNHHAMICLAPFCLAAWLPADRVLMPGLQKAKIQFKKGNKINASVKVSIIENVRTPNGALLLYKIENVKNRQFSPLHRLALFAWFLRSKTNAYHSRKVISALYSYPRRIIIVSYSDENYYNIFPMDIQGYITEENMYLLGLRTTNVALSKILEAKKVVVCDTDTVALDTVYALGKHSSKAPTPKEELSFGISKSELFGFPVPEFTGSYKEIEIIQHKKMGYHMLMIGKVVNQKQLKQNPASLYHVGFLQFKKSSYQSIEGLY